MPNIQDIPIRPQTEPLGERSHSGSFPKAEPNEHVQKPERGRKPVWFILHTCYLSKLMNIPRSMHQLRNAGNETLELKLIFENVEHSISGS